jgi:L-ribulose-5-phosphate 4-epimerase
MTPTEVEGEYESETGAVIVETLARLGLSAAEMPGALVASHGPFTWGKDAQDAADNATALEAVATMAIHTLNLNPAVTSAPDYLMERHFRRKHGPNAYYGQARK